MAHGVNVWERVRRRLREALNAEGRAYTAAQHDRVLELALKALAEGTVRPDQ